MCETKEDTLYIITEDVETLLAEIIDLIQNQIQTTELRLEAIAESSMILANLGLHERARELLLQTISIVKTSKDPRLWYDLRPWALVSEALLDLGEDRWAHEIAKKALQSNKNGINAHYIARIAQRLGNLSLLEDSINSLNKITDKFRCIEAILDVINILIEMGQHTLTVELLNWAYSTQLSHLENPEEFQRMGRITIFLANLGKKMEALQLLQNIVPQAHQMQHIWSRARALGFLVVAFLDLREIAQARRLLDAAIKTVEGVEPKRPYSCEVRLDIAKALALHDYDELAFQLVRAVEPNLAKLNDKDRAFCSIRFADVLFSLKNEADAENYLNKVFSIIEFQSYESINHVLVTQLAHRITQPERLMRLKRLIQNMNIVQHPSKTAEALAAIGCKTLDKALLLEVRDVVQDDQTMALVVKGLLHCAQNDAFVSIKGQQAALDEIKAQLEMLETQVRLGFKIIDETKNIEELREWSTNLIKYHDELKGLDLRKFGKFPQLVSRLKGWEDTQNLWQDLHDTLRNVSDIIITRLTAVKSEAILEELSQRIEGVQQDIKQHDRAISEKIDAHDRKTEVAHEKLQTLLVDFRTQLSVMIDSIGESLNWSLSETTRVKNMVISIHRDQVAYQEKIEQLLQERGDFPQIDAIVSQLEQIESNLPKSTISQIKKEWQAMKDNESRQGKLLRLLKIIMLGAKSGAKVLVPKLLWLVIPGF